jgi:hypothetical protein
MRSDLLHRSKRNADSMSHVCSSSFDKAHWNWAENSPKGFLADANEVTPILDLSLPIIGWCGVLLVFG